MQNCANSLAEAREFRIYAVLITICFICLSRPHVSKHLKAGAPPPQTALRVMQPQDEVSYYGKMKKITNNGVGETAAWTRRKDTAELPSGLEVMKSRRVRGEEIIKQEERKIIRECRKCCRLLSFPFEELWTGWSNVSVNRIQTLYGAKGWYVLLH